MKLTKNARLWGEWACLRPADTRDATPVLRVSGVRVLKVA